MTNIWTLAAVALYTITVLAIGYFATKRVRSMRDYMIAGKEMGFWLTTFGVVATIVSGSGIVGMGGSGYGTGYALYVMTMGLSYVGLVVAYWLLAKPMTILADKYEVYTISDVLALRYGNNSWIRGLSAVAVIIGCFVYLVVQFVSMAWVGTTLFGWSYTTSIIATAVVIGLYTVGGGMLAAMWTNFFQMCVMLIFTISLAITSIVKVGGLTELHLKLASIDPQLVQPFHDSGPFAWPGVLSYALFVGLLAYAGVPHVATKFLTIRSTQVVRWAPLFSIFLYLFAIASIWTGMAGRILAEQGVIAPPDVPDQIIPHMVQSLFPPVVVGIMLAAVLAAAMSTTESFLLLTSAAFVRDIWKNTLGRPLTDAEEVRWTRICTTVVLVVAMLLAFNPPAFVLALMAVAWGAFAAMLGPALYLGLRWKRANTPGAIASLLIGILIGGVCGILNSSTWADSPVFAPWNTAAVGVLFSYITLIGVSLLTRPERSVVFDHFPSPNENHLLSQTEQEVPQVP